MTNFRKRLWPRAACKRCVIWAGIAFVGFSFPCAAQHKSIEYQKQVWIRYSNRLELSEKWELTTDIEERHFVFPGQQHQLLFLTNAQYKFTEGWHVGGGITYGLQSLQDPRFDLDLMVPELRPHQEVHYRSKFSDRWIYRHRFKLEERFIRKVAGGKLADGYLFLFRFRLKMDLYYTLLKSKSDKGSLLVVVSDEVLLNASERVVYNVFDQNRLYGGLRYNISQALAVEAGYLLWFQQRAVGDEFFHRDILRVSVFHKMSLLKKKS